MQCVQKMGMCTNANLEKLSERFDRLLELGETGAGLVKVVDVGRVRLEVAGLGREGVKDVAGRERPVGRPLLELLG